MLGLPWYGRLIIDSALIFGPFYALTRRPLSPQATRAA